MSLNTYGNISQRTAAYVQREMLKHATPVIVLQTLAMTKPIPMNTADTMKFRRPVPFSANTVPLSEGVTPTAQAMSYVDVSVQLQQYGGLVTVSDKIEDLCEDPVLNNA